MSKINYQALREAAEKATWGDWDSYKPHRGARGYEVRLSSQAIAQHVLKNNAEFIAAFNPKIALALLDERERNQQYIKRRDQENEDIALTVGKLRVELEAAENNLIDSECHVAELEEALRDKQALLEASEKRNAKLQSENAYIRNRYKELDLLIGKNILVMQAAIIEWQATGDAKSGLAWIYNTLFGPGELPDESEKDAQAYFNRKYAPIDEKLMALHKWFWEQSEAERAAGIRIKGE
ncbi:ead/Ea22-like family protein [Escherichia coli]|uniref:ead/Ea22-like family protein n=1 Tax=Escherichia coli TaxID=562 RepID=UPI0007A0D53B|nr:ead/Ea22-like family protein [Escherichia coli]EES2004818.1 ead/Ea22-like family protein [Escherichia coli]EFG1553716.1 ead/Ea22-like family protein [Escherichia coli]EFO2472861.1 ead/Ea22-like family protein [Escherichia coli]EFO3125045.1 ead/Ea22-like family protein [Escherichia coli]EFO4154676.1 ead/Ea22-like family protein [Escherichia coli]